MWVFAAAHWVTMRKNRSPAVKLQLVATLLAHPSISLHTVKEWVKKPRWEFFFSQVFLSIICIPDWDLSPDLFDSISICGLISAFSHSECVGALRKTRHVQNERNRRKKRRINICEPNPQILWLVVAIHTSACLFGNELFIYSAPTTSSFIFSPRNSSALQLTLKKQPKEQNKTKKYNLRLEECLKRRNVGPPAKQLRTQNIRQHRKNKHPSAATTRPNTLWCCDRIY